MPIDDVDPVAASEIAVPEPGKVYQSVAQSAAIAIQDAADALRNLTTIEATAAGVAMAEMLRQQAPPTHPPALKPGEAEGDAS
jgi:hypothetical protein